MIVASNFIDSNNNVSIVLDIDNGFEVKGMKDGKYIEVAFPYDVDCIKKARKKYDTFFE